MKTDKPLILIAEDSPDILMVLIELFEMEGYRVSTCSDGKGAWDYLQNCIRCPDLVISDIMMPRMNGLTLRENMLKDERFKDIPMIFYSAVGTWKTKANVLEALFLLKPFDVDEVIATVERSLKLLRSNNHEKISRNSTQSSTGTGDSKATF